MKRSIKDSSEQGQLMRRLAAHVKTWGQPDSANVLDMRYVERLTMDPTFKPRNMSQGSGGTWIVRAYIGGKQWPIAYVNREEQWMAALIADIALLTLWPYRAEYDGQVTPPADYCNHRPDEVYAATLEHSEFGGHVREWARVLNDAIVRFGWARSIGQDPGSEGKRNYRTITDAFNNFQWKQDEFNQDVIAALSSIKVHNEAVAKDLASLFSQQQSLHEKMESLFGAVADNKATLDLLASGITELLRLTGVPAFRPDGAPRVLDMPLKPGPFPPNMGQTVKLGPCEGLDKKPLRFEPARVPICPWCKNEIDPEVCHCGDDIKSHGIGSGHSPVPMGCTCGYPSSLSPDFGKPMEKRHGQIDPIKADRDCFAAEGRSDYFDGLERNECTYSEGTDGRAGWLIGWDNAHATTEASQVKQTLIDPPSEIE